MLAGKQTHTARRVSASHYRGRQSLKVSALWNPGPQKDATAELLQAAFKYALQTRLKTYQSIDVDVRSNAIDLMSGKFGGMTVGGKGWRTPLALTAQSLEVSVGELVVDQAVLMFQQRVALKNIPNGRVTFVLSAQDLGNFMVHPLMKAASGKAVNGQPFVFDPSTVQFIQSPDNTSSGSIDYIGRVGTTGPSYKVSMDAFIDSSAAPYKAGVSSQQQRPGAGGKPAQRIRVTATRVAPPATATTTAASGSSNSSGSAAGRVGSMPGSKAVAGGTQPQAQAAPVAVAVATIERTAQESSGDEDTQQAQHQLTAEELALDASVSDALSALFSALSLNLQGVEISKPLLRLLPSSKITGRVVSRPQGAQGNANQQLFLEISMQLRLLDLPPLNMKF